MGALIGGQEIDRAAAFSPTSAPRSRRPISPRSVPQRHRAVAEGHARRPSQRFADVAPVPLPHAIDPYLISHPLPPERIASSRRLAKQSPYFEVKDPPALQARHDMMRAKLFGFVERGRDGDAPLSRPPTPRCRPATPGRSRPTAADGSPRRCRDRRAHRRAARQSLLPGAEGPGAARGRPRPPGDRAAAPGGRACAECSADPRHARAGAASRPTTRSVDEAIRELSQRRRSASPTAPRPSSTSPWPTAARAISAMAELAAAQAFLNIGD